MHTLLQKKAKKVIDSLPDNKLRVVIDFMGYLQSKENVPNALTLATFRKTDSGKDIVRSKNVDDMFKKLNS